MLKRSGGGIFSSLIFAQHLIWKGKRKAGYQLSMGVSLNVVTVLNFVVSAVATSAAAFAVNFAPVWRTTIIAGSGMVFISSLNRYNALNKKQKQDHE